MKIWVKGSLILLRGLLFLCCMKYNRIDCAFVLKGCFLSMDNLLHTITLMLEGTQVTLEIFVLPWCFLCPLACWRHWDEFPL